MSKILILKEVKAISSCGTEIIVEQVFEKKFKKRWQKFKLDGFAQNRH